MAVEGKNEVARSLLDLQPTAILELYKLYPDVVNSPSVYLSFHGGSVFGGNVIWQGIQYIPIPVEAEGFGIFADGTLPRPKLKVGNNDKIVTYFLGKYKDFKNAKIYRKKVFLKHLDDANFDGENPFGLANSDSEISEEKYLIGQKVQENKAYVEFELNLPLDLDNFDVNHRTVNAKYCYWQYRGLGCRYHKKPIEKEDGTPFTNINGEVVTVTAPEDFNTQQYFYQPNSGYSAGDIVYLENKNVILNDPDGGPSFYHRTWYVCVSGNTGQHPEDNVNYWQKDGCTKKIEACQKRFSSESLKRISFDEEESTFDYLHLNDGAAASLMTMNADVTGVFHSDNWTLSVWMRGKRQNQLGPTSWRNPSVFATHQLPRYNATYPTLFSPPEDGAFAMSVAANLHFSNFTPDNEGLFLDLACGSPKAGKGGELHRIETQIASEDKFHCLVFRKNTNAEIEIIANPHKDQYGVFSSSSRKTIKSVNEPTGVDFFALFADQEETSLNEEICFNGDIAQACLWDRKLTDDEVSWIGSANSVADIEYYLTDDGEQKRIDKYNNYTPITYAETTGYLSTLRNNAIFWFDMRTGDAGGSNFYLFDETDNQNNLTGYGSTEEFEKRTIEYVKAKFYQYVPNQNGEYVLPFGGFPGTDGFEYKAQGSQDI